MTKNSLILFQINRSRLHLSHCAGQHSFCFSYRIHRRIREILPNYIYWKSPVHCTTGPCHHIYFAFYCKMEKKTTKIGEGKRFEGNHTSTYRKSWRARPAQPEHVRAPLRKGAGQWPLEKGKTRLSLRRGTKARTKRRARSRTLSGKEKTMDPPLEVVADRSSSLAAIDINERLNNLENLVEKFVAGQQAQREMAHVTDFNTQYSSQSQYVVPSRPVHGVMKVNSIPEPVFKSRIWWRKWQAIWWRNGNGTCTPCRWFWPSWWWYGTQSHPHTIPLSGSITPSRPDTRSITRRRYTLSLRSPSQGSSHNPSLLIFIK